MYQLQLWNLTHELRDILLFKTQAPNTDLSTMNLLFLFHPTFFGYIWYLFKLFTAGLLCLLSLWNECSMLYSQDLTAYYKYRIVTFHESYLICCQLMRTGINKKPLKTLWQYCKANSKTVIQRLTNLTEMLTDGQRGLYKSRSLTCFAIRPKI